jgi:hypothetical protein
MTDHDQSSNADRDERAARLERFRQLIWLSGGAMTHELKNMKATQFPRVEPEFTHSLTLHPALSILPTATSIRRVVCLLQEVGETLNVACEPMYERPQAA